jgi:uncharacterized protein (DUF1778 family)
MNKRRRYKAKRKRAEKQAAQRFPVYERIVLSPEDFAVFLGAIEQPPQPNERLKALFRRPMSGRVVLT